MAIRPASVPFVIMGFKILHETIVNDDLNALWDRKYHAGFSDCNFTLPSTEQCS